MEELIASLKSDDAARRRDAARELGMRGDPLAVPALIDALRRPSQAHGVEDPVEHASRAAAAVALGRSGDASATEALLEAAADPFKLGSAASTALGQLQPPPVESLLQAARSTDKWLRTRAASALGEVGDPRAVDVLIALLRDEENVVQRAAASAFERLRDPRAVTPLIDLLRDPTTSSFVRIYAAMALGALGDPAAVEVLTAQVESPESNLRRAAARALGRIADPCSRGLLDRLAAEDPDKTVRDVVAKYLRVEGEE
jgi:HEAT repeat protein